MIKGQHDIEIEDSERVKIEDNIIKMEVKKYAEKMIQKEKRKQIDR